MKIISNYSYRRILFWDDSFYCLHHICAQLFIGENLSSCNHQRLAFLQYSADAINRLPIRRAHEVYLQFYRYNWMRLIFKQRKRCQPCSRVSQSRYYPSMKKAMLLQSQICFWKFKLNQTVLSVHQSCAHIYQNLLFVKDILNHFFSNLRCWLHNLFL